MELWIITKNKVLKFNKMENKFRIPRKLKKKIPKGPYCYKGIKFDWSTGIYHIKPCVFYKSEKLETLIVKYDKFKSTYDDSYFDDCNQQEKKEILNEYVGYCKLFKSEIDDQCKNCSINW